MDGIAFNLMLERLAEGWSERQYENVAAEFAETLFYSDSLNYTFEDNGLLLEFFQNDDGQPQFCEFHNSVFDEERQIGVAEYTYKGTYQYHGTVWIEVEGGKIATWREYQHKSEKSWEEFWNK